MDLIAWSIGGTIAGATFTAAAVSLWYRYRMAGDPTRFNLSGRERIRCALIFWAWADLGIIEYRRVEYYYRSKP